MHTSAFTLRSLIAVLVVIHLLMSGKPISAAAVAAVVWL